MEVKSESEVDQLCPTPSDPMDCSLPGSSVHGIFQARELEWDAIVGSINSSALSSLYSPTFTSIDEYWKNDSFDFVKTIDRPLSAE